MSLVIKRSIQLEALRALVEYMRLIYTCHLYTTVTHHVISLYMLNFTTHLLLRASSAARVCYYCGCQQQIGIGSSESIIINTRLFGSSVISAQGMYSPLGYASFRLALDSTHVDSIGHTLHYAVLTRIIWVGGQFSV